MESEKRYQKLWQDEKAFESDAPSRTEFPMGSVTPDELAARVPKFYGKLALLSDLVGHANGTKGQWHTRRWLSILPLLEPKL